MRAYRIVTLKVHDVRGLRLLLVILGDGDVTQLFAMLEIQLSAFDQIVGWSLVLDKALGLVEMIISD